MGTVAGTVQGGRRVAGCEQGSGEGRVEVKLRTPTDEQNGGVWGGEANLGTKGGVGVRLLAGPGAVWWCRRQGWEEAVGQVRTRALPFADTPGGCVKTADWQLAKAAEQGGENLSLR